MVAISSQIPSHLIGRGRGYLHELPDQLASFAPIVKHAARAHSVESIPGLVAQAWRIALTPPSGPVYLEIPVDLLSAPAPGGPVTTLEAMVERQCAPLEQVLTAATRLAHAKHPVIWAGGGVLRSGATRELRELAELIQAPVATTYMGKGAIPADHPLAAGSGCDEAALQELLVGRRRRAVRRHGTGGRDDRPVRPALQRPGHPPRRRPRAHRRQLQRPAPVGDAKLTLLALFAELSLDHPTATGTDAEARVAAATIASAPVCSPGREIELGLLETIERRCRPTPSPSGT